MSKVIEVRFDERQAELLIKNQLNSLREINHKAIEGQITPCPKLFEVIDSKVNLVEQLYHRLYDLKGE